MSTFDWPEMSAIRNATGCTFRPKGGYSRTCIETATRILRGNPDVRWSHDERRCERHFNIDKRTYAKRGEPYSLDRLAKYVRFDADSAKREAVAEHRARKAAVADEFWANVKDYAKARDLAGLRDFLARSR